MTVAVNAIYENGVLKPEGPLALKEQAKVRVIIQSDEESAAFPTPPKTSPSTTTSISTPANDICR